MFDYENECLKSGFKIIAGMDEAGRGPLAGPVAVAIAIMPLEQDKIIEGVNDSKKLTEKKRDALYEQIINTAISYHIEFVDENTIDTINILNATKLGMIKCIKEIGVSPDIVLIDAVKLDADVPTKSIIKGDALSYSIACASILAKVSRDRLMLELDKKYPQYNLKKHKGYGTKEHIENLKKYGPSPIHRKSFIGHFVDVEKL
ncbi:MAG: ribonuclease HII [Firmicutes bacterium]|nr:ribonuclease HII [Bacillota bacterium]MDY5676211.1 ribonuclease HII [Eubacteriales bacterium]